MNVLRFAAFTTALLAAAALGVGCGYAPSSGAEANTPEGIGSSTVIDFKAGEGLSIPRENAAYLGLEIAKVTERTLISSNGFTVRLYQPGQASGTVPAAEGARLHAGQALSITLDTGEIIPGRVARLGRDAWRGEMVEVLLEFLDRQGRGAPGSFASALVIVEQPQAVMSVPRSSLLHTVEGWFVYKRNGERLIRTAVAVGVMNDKFSEITSGLSVGDEFAVTPVMKLWLAELHAIRGGADAD